MTGKEYMRNVRGSSLGSYASVHRRRFSSTDGHANSTPLLHKNLFQYFFISSLTGLKHPEHSNHCIALLSLS